MFWKKGEKGLSRKDVLASQVEQLGPGQALRFKLIETYGGGLAVIELNPAYPAKGHKYTMSTETMQDGKPTGKKTTLWDSDKPKDLAGWILDRNGEPFTL